MKRFISDTRLFLPDLEEVAGLSNAQQWAQTELHHCLTPNTETNSQWIKNANARPQTIKLLEENIRGNLLNINLSNDVLDLIQKTKTTKAEINKWDSIKLRSFWAAINKMKRQHREQEKTPENHEMGKGLVPRTHRELTHHKRKKIQFKNGQRMWTDIFPKNICSWLTGMWKDVQHH